METVRVNMTPNNEVKTIHCSQNDGNTRKWGFELYKEDGVIDGSSIKEQMLFNAYKGGTEQILPENTSTPTTSPIIADIQYKDALRSEQEFLYRESPATEDGQAKITKIKGNTVKFNQLVQNGNFVDNSGWTVNRGTLSVSNNKATYTSTEKNGNGRLYKSFSTIANHKYFLSAYVKISENATPCFGVGTLGSAKSVSANTRTKIADIITHNATETTELSLRPSYPNGLSVNATMEVENFMCFDLTAIFDSGNEPSTTSAFEAWLQSHIGNLPYYDYTLGTLLSFNGTGIKVTGKNLYGYNTTPTIIGQGITYTDNGDGSYTVSGTPTAYSHIDFPKVPISASLGTVVVSGWQNTKNMACDAVRLFDSNSTQLALLGASNPNPFAINLANYPTVAYLSIAIKRGTNNVAVSGVIYAQIEIGNTASSSYVPYSTDTLSLPISTYFPDGMMSAGSVYDELTEDKAYTRIGSVDLGDLTYTYDSSNTRFRATADQFTNMKIVATNNDVVNAVIAGYTAYSNNNDWDGRHDMSFFQASNGNVFIVNKNYTDATTFKNAMNGVLLFYELATPTETDITTASLVTEKGEAPLYYDDGLIADCNETISSESGMFDAKIKLMDSETVYSQKIQLHVERKP